MQSEDGIVEAKLPKALYRIRLDTGRYVTAAVASSTKHTTVKIIPGDRVRVEISTIDPTRGKILARQS